MGLAGLRSLKGDNSLFEDAKKIPMQTQELLLLIIVKFSQIADI